MKQVSLCFLFALSLLCMGSYTAHAEEPRRLFTHISSDNNHRLQKALGFTANEMDRGVSVAIWADDKAVLALSQKNRSLYAKEHGLVARLIKGKAPVIACPFSMKQYGVSAEDLLPGVTLGGSLDLVNELLYVPGVRVLNW